MQGLFSVLLYYWYYWQRNVIYFYNLSEMSFTFVLLCFMADKHVSTCDTNTTLFSMEINYPNLWLSLPSISNASYSKCSRKSYTLSSLFFHLTAKCVPWCGSSVYHQLLTLGHKKRRQEFQLKSCRSCELRNLTF